MQLLNSRLLIITIAYVAISGFLYGQFAGRPSQPLVNRVRQMREHIEEKRQKLGQPKVQDRLLKADANLLIEAAPSFKADLDWITLSRDQTENIVLWCWFDLRSNPESLQPAEPLTFEKLSSRFNSFIAAMGCIDIQSRPPGAKIDIDGNKHTNPTNDQAFEEAGEHRIRLNMPGYKTIEESIIVEKRKTTNFHRVLVREK